MGSAMNFPYLVMGLVTGGFYSLVVLGFSLGWAVAKMPDIGYLAFIYVAGETTAVLCHMLKIEPIFIAPFAAVSFFGLGILIYRTFISFLLSKIPEPGLAGLTLTFGLSIILENLMMVIFTPDFRSVTSTYKMSIGGVILTVYHALTLPSAIMLSLILYYIVFKTKWGIRLRAAVQEPMGAVLYGIDTEKIRAIVYGIMYSIGGFTGTLIPVIQYVHPSALWNVIPLSFIIANMGGIGSIIGTVVIGTCVGLVVSYTSALLPAAWVSTELFLMLMLILLLRPQGLFKGLG